MRLLTDTFSKNFIFSVLSKRERAPLCFASMPSLLYPLEWSVENRILKISIGHMKNSSTSFPIQHDYLQTIFSDIEKSPHLFPHNSAKLHPQFWNLFSFSVLSKLESIPLCSATMSSTSLAVQKGQCTKKFARIEKIRTLLKSGAGFLCKVQRNLYVTSPDWKVLSFL